MLPHVQDFLADLMCMPMDWKYCQSAAFKRVMLYIQ